MVKAGARDHTDPIFKKLNTLSFKEMLTIEVSKLGYKIHNKLLPPLLVRLSDSHGGKKSHRYPTRNKDLPNVQRHVCSKFNNSFMCTSITAYMKLPGITKKSPSLKSFILKFKNDTLKT